MLQESGPLSCDSRSQKFCLSPPTCHLGGQAAPAAPLWGRLFEVFSSTTVQVPGGQGLCLFWLPWCLSLARNVCCSVAELCPTLCHPVDYSAPGFLVLHYFLELAQTHVHWVGDAIQPSRSLSPPSPPALNISQHQGLFQWVSSLHQVAELLELQLQQQSFKYIFRVDFL